MMKTIVRCSTKIHSGCQFTAGLIHGDKQPFMITFTPTRNLESPITLHVFVRGSQMTRRKKPTQTQRKHANSTQEAPEINSSLTECKFREANVTSCHRRRGYQSENREATLKFQRIHLELLNQTESRLYSVCTVKCATFTCRRCYSGS